MRLLSLRAALIAITLVTTRSVAQVGCHDPFIADAGVFPGTNAPVYVMLPAQKDNQQVYYVGGAFVATPAGRTGPVAEWDGQTWHTLGPDAHTIYYPNTAVYDLIEFQGRIIAAGTNLHIDNVGVTVAAWDGERWTALSASAGYPRGSVYALEVHDGSLVGATHTFPTNTICQWTGNEWIPLGDLGVDQGAVYALKSFNGRLYAGGQFYVHGPGGSYVGANLASFDGTQWSAEAGYLWGVVRTFEVIDQTLYAGKEYSGSGNALLGGVIRLGSMGWESVTPLQLHTVRDLAWWNGHLHAALDWGGVSRLEGNQWADLGPAWDDSVRTLAPAGETLLIGGRFERDEDGRARPYVARIYPDGSSSPAALGFDNEITDAIVDGDTLYVTGRFRLSPAGDSRYVARFDGNSWSAFENPIGNVEYGLARNPLVHNGTLYILTQDELTGLYADVRRLLPNGQWEEIGPFGTPIADLIVHNDQIVAICTSVNVNGKWYSGPLAWNGTAWVPVGPNSISESINYHAAADYLGTIYIAGSRTISGNTLSGVARYTAAGWQWFEPLTSGKATFTHMIVHDDMLYVSGDFQWLAGIPAPGLARFDGSSWDVPGLPPFGKCNGITGTGQWLLAGVPGGVAIYHDSKWSLLPGHNSLRPALLHGRIFSAHPTWPVSTPPNQPPSVFFEWFECGQCPADCDSSGTLDLFDFLCFLNLFNSGSQQADCDRNGLLDAFDLLCFLNQFAAGC